MKRTQSGLVLAATAAISAVTLIIAVDTLRQEAGSSAHQVDDSMVSPVTETLKLAGETACNPRVQVCET